MKNRKCKKPQAPLSLIKGVAEEGRTIHRCSVCGDHGVWSEGWMWFGNYLEEEVMFKVCSPKCRSNTPSEWMKLKKYRRYYR